MKQQFFLCLLLFVAATTFGLVGWEFSEACCGKIDAGPAFLHIDVLESRKTVKKINMAAIKVDSAVVIAKRVCIKPSILFGRQGHAKAFSAGCGIGHYTPITEKFFITPTIGFLFTELHTTIRIPIAPEFAMHFKERFRSVAPYASLEFLYCFNPQWRLLAFYQYAWSHTHTTIKGLLKAKSHSDGPNYGLLLERDFNAKWSMNIGAAYNISLTKEKHGLRGYGIKIGLAYWF